MSLKGLAVKVVKGRSDVGFVGKVFWEGMFYPKSNKYHGAGYVRLGVKDDAGKVAWVYGSNVERAWPYDEVMADLDDAKALLAADDAAKVKKALADSAGVDWKAGVKVSSSSGGWSDNYVYDFPFAEGASDGALAAAVKLRYPVESSWGNLRWCRGGSVVGIDRASNVVRVAWSDGMAD